MGDTIIFTEDPVEFIYHYATYKDKDKLRERIQKHVTYKTCKIILDSAGMVCVICLWNIADDGKVAHIFDLIIREDKRKKDIMRAILKEGMDIWNVEFIEYDRDYTVDGTNRGETRIWSTKRFLRRRA